MLCIHIIISYLSCAEFPSDNAEIGGNVDLRIGFAQLGTYLHPYDAWLLQNVKTPEDCQTESWSR